MKNKTAKQISWLLIISILPLIASWFLYHNHRLFQLKTLNHGTLVSPPLTSQDLAMNQNSPKKWQIVYMPNHCCNADCEKKMFTLHQLRKALGKDRDRVNLTLAVDQTCPLRDSHDFQELLLTSEQYQHWQKAFQQRDTKFRLQNDVVTNKIYLIDPIGNLFMYYSDITDPMNILKDLNKVLEVSQIG